MKKLLLAIFSLISIISYSQTTGYFRYDTVRIQKVGANSTLIIENATRDSLGFLYNYGGGRTKFEVIRSVPGGIKVGNDTIIVDQSDLSDRLISGGQVTYSGTGLKFYISPAVYVINETIYTTDYDSVTLSASDPADPRKDVIYLATTGVEVLEGTPAGPASEPQLEYGQLKLTVVDVPAGATTPGITQSIIYDENTGESVVTNIGTTTDPDNLVFPFHLTKSVNVTTVNGDDAVIFTLPSTVDLNIFNGISFFIKLKQQIPSARNLTMSFYNGVTQVTPEIVIGLNKNSLEYQGVSLIMSRFTSGASNTFIDKIYIRHRGAGTALTGFYLDYVYFQSGLVQPGSGSDPVTIGPIDSKLPSPNGMVAENNILYLQTATQTHRGVMSEADKLKLDSIHSDYFIENAEATHNQLAIQVNDSTVGIKTLKDSTGIGIVDNGTYLSIYSTGGGGSEGFEDVIINDNVITADRSVQLGPTNEMRWAAVNPGVDSVIQRHTGGLWNVQWDAGITANTAFYLSPTIVQMQAYNGGANHGGRFTIDGFDVMDGAVYTDFDGTPTGIKYAGDYSASFVNRSLVDKEYVDNAVGGGASIWNGAVIGTTFSATSTTINNGAVQWTFTGSSPATFTLPARTSSVNQFYTVKNIGSADLTVAAAGTDDIYTTSAVTSITVAPGESVMLTGAANGTSDLWTALFHTQAANLLVDSTDTDGPATVFAAGDTLRARTMTGTGGIVINLSSTGGYEIDGSGVGGGANTTLSNLTSPTAINQHLIPGTTNTYDLGTTTTLFRNMYAHGYVVKNSSNGLTTLAGAPSASNFTATFPAATGPVALTNLAQTWSGIQTLGSLTVTTGGLVSALTNANFAYGTASGLSSTTSAAFLLESNANVNYRVAVHGASAIATVNSSAGSLLVAENTIQEAASSNHDLLYTVAIKPSVVTGAAATVTNTATLEVVGPMSATVSGANWAFRVKSGNVQFLNGNLSLGTAGNKINIATGTNASVGISGAMTAGSITISTTAVTANSIISLTPVGAGTGVISIGTITAGTSFVINSSDNTDTRIVHWKIIN